MNLRIKLIVLSASLAAFTQAQETNPTEIEAFSSEIIAAVDSAQVVDPIAEQPADSIASAPEVAAVDSAATDSAVVDVAIAETPAAITDSVAVADSITATPAKSDSVAAETTVAVADSATVTDSTATEITKIDTVAATETKTAHILDIVHGNAYNVVGNEAASATIGSDLAMPHKMKGHKLGYFEPIEGYGVAAFGDNNTYFIAFDNGENLGLVTAGIATSKFGAALRVSLGKNQNTIHSDADGSEQEKISIAPGSLIGAVASSKIGNFDISVDMDYTHPDIYTYTSAPNTETEINSWDFAGKATIANYSNSKFVWAANLSFLRHEAKTKTKTVTYFVGPDDKEYVSTYKSSISDTSSRVEVVPEFNMASTVLESEKARLHVGMNVAVPMMAFDRIDGIVSRHNEYGLQLVPNILGEVALGKYVMAFGSASYQWDVIEISDVLKSGVNTKNTKTETGTTTANIGMRAHMEHAALELTFTKQFLQNPFSSFSNTDEIGVSLGAFILF